MKRRVILAGAILAVAVIGFTSCEKAEDLNVNNIEGVYVGTFSVSSSLKAAVFDGGEGNHGTAEISMMGDMQIEVPCRIHKGHFGMILLIEGGLDRQYCIFFVKVGQFDDEGPDAHSAQGVVAQHMPSCAPKHGPSI